MAGTEAISHSFRSSANYLAEQNRKNAAIAEEKTRERQRIERATSESTAEKRIQRTKEAANELSHGTLSPKQIQERLRLLDPEAQASIKYIMGEYAKERDQHVLKSLLDFYGPTGEALPSDLLEQLGKNRISDAYSWTKTAASDLAARQAYQDTLKKLASGQNKLDHLYNWALERSKLSDQSQQQKNKILEAIRNLENLLQIRHQDPAPLAALATRKPGLAKENEGNEKTVSDLLGNGADRSALPPLTNEGHSQQKGRQNHQEEEEGSEEDSQETSPKKVKLSDLYETGLNASANANVASSSSFNLGANAYASTGSGQTDFLSSCQDDVIFQISSRLMSFVQPLDILLNCINEELDCKLNLYDQIGVSIMGLGNLSTQAQIDSSQQVKSLNLLSSAFLNILTMPEDGGHLGPPDTRTWNITACLNPSTFPPKCYFKDANNTEQKIWDYAKQYIGATAARGSDGTALTANDLQTLASTAIRVAQSVQATVDLTNVNLTFSSGTSVNFWKWLVDNNIVDPSNLGYNQGKTVPLSTLKETLQQKATGITSLNQIILAKLQKTNGERILLFETVSFLIKKLYDTLSRMIQAM